MKLYENLRANVESKLTELWQYEMVYFLGGMLFIGLLWLIHKIYKG